MATDVVTITQPGTPPITTAQAKTHLRVDFSSDDTYIDELVSVATTRVEALTGFRLFTQTSELRADSFRDSDLIDPAEPDILRLRIAPVKTVTSVKYDDGDDVEQTLSSSNYWEDLLSVPPRIQVKEQWPETRDKIAAVRIRLATGFTDGVGDLIPEHFRLAVKLLIGHWYENREEVTELQLAEVPEGIMSILLSHPEYHFYVMSS